VRARSKSGTGEGHQPAGLDAPPRPNLEASPRLGPDPGQVTATPKLDRYRLLLDVAERLSMTFDRADLQQTVVAATETLLGADLVLLRTKRDEELELVGWSGFDEATSQSLRPLNMDEPWLKDAIAAGRAWVCNDVQALPGTAWADRFGDGLGIRADLFVPLVHGGRLIGSLTAAMRSPRAWTDEDVEIMSALSVHVALALRNAELFERLEARAAQMAVVQAASARMNRAKSVESVGRVIVEEVATIVDYHNARVYVLDPPDDLEPIAFEGKVGAYEIVDWSVLRTKVGEGFTGWVAANGTPLCIPDANADPRGAQIPGTDDVQESMLVVPMRHDDDVVGVITLSKLGLNQFNDDDLQVLMILADQAATALESARLLTQTQSMATELRRLLEMSQELSQTLDSRHVGVLIARHLTLALDVDACAISTWDIPGDRIVPLGAYPDGDWMSAQPIYELAEYPQTRRVLEDQVTVIIDAGDPLADPAETAILRDEGYRMLAMIPLIAKGEAVGLVELMTTGARTFDENRLALARTPARWPTATR